MLDYKLTELDYLVVSGKTTVALDSLQALLPRVNPIEQSPNWLSSFYLLASNIYQKNGTLESSLRYYQMRDSVEEFLVDEKRNIRGEELRRKFDLVAKEA